MRLRLAEWIGTRVRSDRAFFRLQYDAGRSAFATDPISPIFDADFNQPSWQGQVVETHTFGASAASQFLVAGSYFAPIFEVKNPSQALSAFPTILIFIPGTFTELGGKDNVDAFGYGRYNTQFQLSEDVVKTLGQPEVGIRCKLCVNRIGASCPTDRIQLELLIRRRWMLFIRAAWTRRRQWLILRPWRNPSRRRHPCRSRSSTLVFMARTNGMHGLT